MIKLLISVVILIVAANVAIAHCKHRSREVFYPSPHNEHIIIDDIPKEIHRHPHHHRRVHDKINTDNLDDEIRKILPDILNQKHHKGGRNIRRNDPVVHLSVEYDDKGKTDLDENDRVKPVHKVIKKVLPDWLDERRDLNWNDKSQNKWRDDKEWIGGDHQTRRVWENDDPHINWHNKKLDYDNDGSDLILKSNDHLNILVPELVLDRSGEKNGLVELNDNIHDFLWNTTKTAADNIHNLENDLLNVKLNFKPILSLKTKDVIDADLNIDPITVKRKNDRHVRNHRNIWDPLGDYPKWLKRHPQLKFSNENIGDEIKDKVHDDLDDWTNKQDDKKQWKNDIPEPQWKHSSSDDDISDVIEGVNIDGADDDHGSI